jgi:lipopolysaccharide transport system ATP-binding protein
MSSNDIVVAVRGLSKSYVIAHNATKHTTLTEAITHRVKNPLHRAEKETFWALKDIEFDVKKGDVVGIIGRNGAGKSTLLKILSQITEPTTGEVRLYGRVGSLLEVGTGFHPELTGRENIYLNGAILGMRKKEIDRQFDEIVDFAEVEQFLDTPVKRYSSGMYVRLAFAVAAHLNPEILVVDEVLSVGDAGFQKKCLGKMESIATSEGRTILFVSHNMTAVEALCNRCIGISSGHITHTGTNQEVIPEYLSDSFAESNAMSLDKRIDRTGSGEARFTKIGFLDEQGQQVSQVPMGAPVTIEAHYHVSTLLREPVFGFFFTDLFGKTVMRSYSHESYSGVTPTLQKNGVVRCLFHSIPLMHGSYKLHVWLSQHRHPVDYIEYAATLDVSSADVYGTGRAPDSNNGGVCFALHEWEIE